MKDLSKGSMMVETAIRFLVVILITLVLVALFFRPADSARLKVLQFVVCEIEMLLAIAFAFLAGRRRSLETNQAIKADGYTLFFAVLTGRKTSLETNQAIKAATPLIAVLWFSICSISFWLLL